MAIINRKKVLKKWFISSLDDEDRVSWQFLWKMLRHHSWFVTLAFGFSFIAALFESSTIGLIILALESLAGDVSSQASTSFDFLLPLLKPIQQSFGQDGYFLGLVGLAVVAQLFLSGSEYCGRAFTALVQARVERDIRKRVFRQFMGLSYGQVRKSKVGDLASYNSQVTYVGMVIQLGNLIISNIIMMLMYAFLLLWLSWGMTLVAIVLMGFVSVGLSRLVTQIRLFGRLFKNANVELNEVTIEFLSGLRVIKSFAREAYAISNIDTVIQKVYDARRRALLRQEAIGPLIDMVAVVSVALFLGVGFIFFYDGQVDALPRLLTFIFILYRLMPRVRLINDKIGTVNNFWAFVTRIGEFLNKEGKEFSRKGSQTFSGILKGIEFEHVSIRYGQEDKWVLDDVSVGIPRGSMVALVGESGAGKSTMADLILGMYLPVRGRILVDGKDLMDLNWEDWRNHIGVVDQDAFIFHASVRENIAFGDLDASDEEIVEAAITANAHEFIEDLTDGYDTVVGDRGFRLSGGQRQRIAIARAVLRNPDLLILDEATSDLDSQSEKLIQEAIDNLRSDRTVLIIAHRLSTIVNADKIVVLENGRLVEQGNHKVLLDAGGAYSKFWRIQTAS